MTQATKNIINQALQMGAVDTRKYRYYRAIKADYTGYVIKRIERAYLDTTACLSDASDYNPYGWQIVHGA